MTYSRLRFTLIQVLALFVMSLVMTTSSTQLLAANQRPASASLDPLPAVQAEEPTNVIFMIGDGMGNTQVSAARAIGIGKGGRLNMDRMPYGGMVTTYSANNMITDSAAAATALSTGFKTKNGTLGIDPKGQRLQTILEAAKSKGMATGLVTTTTITHATPAGFSSHVPSRGTETEIAVQQLELSPDVLLGGGKENFVPQSVKGSKRKDDRDLIAEAKQRGYQFVETAEQLQSAKGPKLLGLFEMYALTTEAPEPPLADLAGKAIQILSRNKRGFFVMIEGGQIDWRCHANDAQGEVKQALDFDAAIARALDFAAKDGHTLVIVTADHETGGMALNGDEKGSNELQVAWTTKGHTGSQVPLFAYGPGASKFTGVHDNTDLPKLVARLLGIRGFASGPVR